jgi:predicted O-methyltransferase YrrM
MCRVIQPNTVLDLGSGFSSYVVRSYQATSRDAVVTSVDDSPEWLDRTRDYLQQLGLSTDALMSLDDFESAGLGRFDLVVYDLGSMETRARWLNNAISYIRPSSGVAIIDDCHFSDFASQVTEAVGRLHGKVHDVARVTRDRFGRRSLLVAQLSRTQTPI